jgi:hypothetical protein
MALDTIRELLAAVERLPEPGRTEARGRVVAAISQPAPAARLALGTLALDLLDLTDVSAARPTRTA